jgi:predicted dehydrogenase
MHPNAFPTSSISDPLYCEAALDAKFVQVGVVGLGYWGPNLARNFDALPGCKLSWCCDGQPAARERFDSVFRGARFTDRFEDLLADPSLDAVAIATPVPTHSELAARVLEAGKHCFVEKPLALKVAEAERVLAAQRVSGRVLMVGHLLEYHPGVRQLKQIVDSGELGHVHYIYSNRLNLGKLRTDENALWSLGAHDISVLLHLAGEEPYELAAHGECYVQPGIEDVVFCFMRFPSGLSAHMHLSWLDPHKERRFTVVGSKRMATFDDMELERKLTIYDKGFDGKTGSWGEYITRSGDIYSPRVRNAEPLRLECEHFLECVRTGAKPRSDGESGLRVVRVLEGLQSELEQSARGPSADVLTFATD